MKTISAILTGISFISLCTAGASADVTHVEIASRAPIADGRNFGDSGAYEQLQGTIHFAIDPANPRNQVIADLDLAPRNGDGLVEMSADFRVLAPVERDRGNGIALVGIANRGRPLALAFNQGDGEFGDGFLMRRGFTIVWVGWEFDVAPGDNAMNIDVPHTAAPGDAPIGGLGFAAVRDTTSWIRYSDSAEVRAANTLAFGVSQSGRFLRSYLYLGFNSDEQGRKVFDGVMSHIAGSSRLDLNRRGANPISLGQFDATSFPFTDLALRDPATGVVAGQLENPRARDNQPLIFYTNTSVEYWGGGRVAALVHSTPDGREDIELANNVRFYLLAGTQHGPGPFPPPPAGAGQQMGNPTNYWWNMRALLVAMEGWLLDGTEPPPSAHPSFADGTLVAAADLGFPAIPGVQSPESLNAGTRAANVLVDHDGGPGLPLPLLVPAVDRDGNETSGIVHPLVSVPLATYTGWNFASPDRGDSNALVPLAGSYVPFPATRTARMASHDPRLSIAERYASKSDYLIRVREAGEALVARRYLLETDLAPIVQRAGDHWDLLIGQAD